jgi:hypothetical protein
MVGDTKFPSQFWSHHIEIYKRTCMFLKDGKSCSFRWTVKVKLSLCLTKHHNMKTYWRSGGIASHSLRLGTRCRWVVSFTTRPLYPQGKIPCYPLNRRLGGPQSRSGKVVKRKIPRPCQESNPRTPIVQPIVQSLYRLSYYGSRWTL